MTAVSTKATIVYSVIPSTSVKRTSVSGDAMSPHSGYTKEMIGLWRNTVNFPYKLCCNGNAIRRTVSIAEPHITVNYIKILCCKKNVLSQIYVTGDYKTFLDHTVSWPIFFSDLNWIWSFSTFHVSPNIKFHGRPSTGSRADTHGQTDRKTQGRAGTTKLTGAFRDYDNAPLTARSPIQWYYLPNYTASNPRIS